MTDHSTVPDLDLHELVLDWNGTVVADRPRALEATNAVLEAHGLAPITDGDFGQLFSLPLRAFLSRLSVPAPALAEAEAAWNRHSIERETVLSPGALQLLTACRQQGVPAGILTAADPAVVTADAGHLKISDLLSWIRGPSRDKAADLLTRTAIPGNVAYVGDTTDDIAYARQAGALAIGFTGGYHPTDQLRDAGPDLLVSDLRQLIPLLPGVPELKHHKPAQERGQEATRRPGSG